MRWLQAAIQAGLRAAFDNVLTLDHAPIVGKTYLVPAVQDVWGNYGAAWPVMTAAPHCDTEDIWDWHLDYRFFTAEQEIVAQWMERRSVAIDHDRPPTFPERRWTGSRASRQFTIIRVGRGKIGAEAFPPVVFRPLVCRRPTVAPEPLAVSWDELAETYGSPAPAIRTEGGRFLCPHQKMDLTHWPREPDGTVICPLHRLRVRVPDCVSTVDGKRRGACDRGTIRGVSRPHSGQPGATPVKP